MIAVKLLILFSALGVIGGIAHPYPTEDVHEDPEWMWFPDGDGNLHLIHLREDQGQPEPRFSAEKNVHFRLYTKRNSDNPQLLKLGDLSSIQKSNFNATTQTFFICHGWRNHGMSPVNTQLRDAYLSAGDYNVIVVDWAAGASANYFSARKHVKTTGQHTGQFINFLVKQAKVSLQRVHLVGHSLGAHAAGFAGKTVVNGKVSTLIGLDPASPLYQLRKPKERVDLDDAEYVEIIHTNSGKLGFWQPLGHADFYPNFGSMQPGCGLDMSGSCAHARAYQYLAESITRTERFRARKCRNLHHLETEYCEDDGQVYLMGGKYNKRKAHGVFILQTAASPPFGLN